MILKNIFFLLYDIKKYILFIVRYYEIYSFYSMILKKYILFIFILLYYEIYFFHCMILKNIFFLLYDIMK